MKPLRMGIAIFLGVSFLISSSTLLSAAPGSQGLERTAGPSPTITLTITSTPCPPPTPEMFEVDPVTSPTDLRWQRIVAYLGNGEKVVVQSESGEFVVTGDFSFYVRPAKVDIRLLPDLEHHLVVIGWVKEVKHGHCIFGGYSLVRYRDRYGGPLTILHSFPVGPAGDGATPDSPSVGFR